ncbi:MAG: hypothetical protein GXY82_05070 [Methanospirillum sp.]|nr:hypothetical protein [Methanospirillum sp.]
MAYEELIRSMEMDAALRIQEVRVAAQAFVDETLGAARQEADRITAGQLAEAERRIEVERHQRLYRVREDLKADLASIQEKYFRRAIAMASDDLAHRRSDGGNPDVLEHLIREALEALGEKRARVHVDPRDESAVRSILAGLPGELEAIPDLETTGGVVVESADGLVRVDNTFEARLSRAAEVHRQEIYRRLFGGG